MDWVVGKINIRGKKKEENRKDTTKKCSETDRRTKQSENTMSQK
jgi:hypothetical protein